MCGGSSVPPDNSAEVARIEAQAAREARMAEAKAAREAERAFRQNLSGSFTSGLEDAKRYFTSQGVDLTDYLDDISAKAWSTRRSVPWLDADPRGYFEGMGEQLYGELENSERSRYNRTLQDLFGQNFAGTAIADTADDPILDAILGEGRSTAEQYVNNLLSRGVITDAGAKGAFKNLDTQMGSARGTLNDIGMGILSSGRGDLDRIVNEAMQGASSVRLGQKFDPYSYKNRANDFITSFMQSLGQKVRDKAPADLFDTSGLAGAAGVAQGAQNTPFDPAALAGIFEEEDDDDDAAATTNATSMSPFG